MDTHGLDEMEVFLIELSERDAVVWRWPKPRPPRVYWGDCDTHGDVGLVAVRRRYPNPGTRRTPA